MPNPSQAPWIYPHLATPRAPLLVTSGGGHWRPVQTCSFQDLASAPSLPREQHLVVATETETCMVSKGRYASYWNAVLFFL